MCRALTEIFFQNKLANMFECMEITEYIYEVVVELSHKKFNMEDATGDGRIRQKIGEAASSNTYSTTSESAVKEKDM